MKWLKSKTVWAAAGLAILAGVDYLNGETHSAVEKVIQVLGLIGVRHAIEKAAGLQFPPESKG